MRRVIKTFEQFAAQHEPTPFIELEEALLSLPHATLKEHGKGEYGLAVPNGQNHHNFPTTFSVTEHNGVLLAMWAQNGKVCLAVAKPDKGMSTPAHVHDKKSVTEAATALLRKERGRHHMHEGRTASKKNLLAIAPYHELALAALKQKKIKDLMDAPVTNTAGYDGDVYFTIEHHNGKFDMVQLDSDTGKVSIERDVDGPGPELPTPIS